MFDRIQKIHMVGIGGSGMSGIAEVLLNRGFQISGSDLQGSAVVRRLEGLGAKIFLGHESRNVGQAQVVVTSSAIPAENPEILEAKRKQVPVIPRAEMLTELMRMKYGIAIAGAHGKTTTTSLALAVLAAGGCDPTAIIGGRLNALGSNAQMGRGDLFLVEADESDGSFLRLSPTVVVITNIDREHLNHYGSMDALRQAFVDFANRVPFYGSAILCLDDPEVQGILPRLRRHLVTYGLSPQAQIRGEMISRGANPEVAVYRNTEFLGNIRLGIPGLHNVRNALASIAVGLECQVAFEDIRKGLERFEGIERRFQKRGERKGVCVMDDYAHHPREIEAALQACRDAFGKRRIVTVFQPHRYSRLQGLFDQFVTSFNETDELIVLPVFAAGEKPEGEVNSAFLAEAIQQHGHQATRFFAKNEALLDYLNTTLQDSDVLLTLGAGDVWKTGRSFLEEVEK